MEGDDLGAEEVVACRQVGGDLDVHLAAAGIEVLGPPIVVVPRATGWVLGPGVLEDFEPAAGAVGGGGVGDFGHVDYDGAVVGAAYGF
jgi:hypothetical protein